MMNMKRDFEGGEPQALKRFRPEEIIGTSQGDHVITRMLMSKLEFSKLIGKGGATITGIRSATGVNVRGTNVEDDLRLVLLAGPFQSVIRAFEMVSEILNGGNSVDSFVLCLNMLLEHSKAGKVVGSKGAMIQSIQSKSGCQNVRIEKEPIDYSGVGLRKLSLEGTLSCVRRAHFMVHELYMQESQGGFFPGQQQPFAHAQPSPFGGQQLPPPMIGNNKASDPDGSVPFPQLVSHGVQQETVRQLTEMKAYLLRHFGLNLLTFREGHSFQQIQPVTMPPMAVVEKLTLEQAIEKRKGAASESQELCFGIRKNCVGGVIGKGGLILKELQLEFSVKIHVEKEEFHGFRLVVLNSLSAGAEGALGEDSAKVAALIQCQAKILNIVQEQEALFEQQALSGEVDMVNA